MKHLEVFRQVYEVSCEKFGVDGDDAVLILGQLIQLYQEWDRPEELQHYQDLLPAAESVAVVP